MTITSKMLNLGQGAYMLGPDLLVVPVIHPSVDTRDLHLPKDTNWVHVWTGKTHGAGETVTVEAPMGKPPVFCASDRWNIHKDIFRES